jgi:hypothetical protein
VQRLKPSGFQLSLSQNGFPAQIVTLPTISTGPILL